MSLGAFSFSRRLASEALGTAFLLAAVVGSGIMGERMSSGNEAIALLANTLATGSALVSLILTFGPISGAHFNPLVSVTEASQGRLPWKEVPGYLMAQFLGALLGVVLAQAMFTESLIEYSKHVRSGTHLMLAESIATIGLIAVIWSCSRTRAAAVPLAVASYIMAAYWFTSSTSFANPAATLARSMTNTFAGIRPSDVPGFIGAQFVGALAAVLLFRWLLPDSAQSREETR